jgi:hypothetical protein
MSLRPNVQDPTPTDGTLWYKRRLTRPQLLLREICNSVADAVLESQLQHSCKPWLYFVPPAIESPLFDHSCDQPSRNRLATLSNVKPVTSFHHQWVVCP